MAALRNGRWAWVAVTASGVAILSTLAATVGIPSCAELVTEAEAKIQHGILEAKVVEVEDDFEQHMESMQREHSEFRRIMIEDRKTGKEDRASSEADRIIIKQRLWSIMEAQKK